MAIIYTAFFSAPDALREKDRNSITLSVNEVSPFSVGMLIALYERTVGYYASMIGINAYHQPGVEAGKKAAAKVLSVRKQVTSWMLNNPNHSINAHDLAQELGVQDQSDWVYKILESLSSNQPSTFVRHESNHALDDLFSVQK